MQNEEKLNISTNETGNIKVQKELVLNKKATPAKNINFIKVILTLVSSSNLFRVKQNTKIKYLDIRFKIYEFSYYRYMIYIS